MCVCGFIHLSRLSQVINCDLLAVELRTDTELCYSAGTMTTIMAIICGKGLTGEQMIDQPLPPETSGTRRRPDPAVSTVLPSEKQRQTQRFLHLAAIICK